MGIGQGGGKDGADVGDWNKPVDEGWLLDRSSLRKSASFNPWSIFPRSPTPQRKNEGPGDEMAAPPPELSREEEARNEKFQAGLKKAIKDEAKDSKKKEKK